MSGSLMDVASSFRAALSEVDPDSLTGTDCARWAAELAATEKACAAVRLLLSARAIVAGAHREEGCSDGVAWLARQSGSTGGAARRALATAGRLAGCPDTKAALRAGDISIAQACEIAEAQAETPGAEAVLLPVARTTDLTRLRDKAREHRQAHIDASALRERQFRRRYLRNWIDRDGLVCIAGALPPERGLPLVHRVREVAERLYRAARAARPPDGTIETFEGYAADALADLVAEAVVDRPRPVRTELTVVCDLFAYRRGHTHPGEVCHIIGGGPIPVPVARELAGDAFVKAVLHDGTDILKVRHFGRHLPAALRTALDLGPVPSFTGRECVDCGSRYGLEYDHVDPVANHGPTSYDNLQARCWRDHQAKTDRDRRAGRLGRSPRAPRAPDTS